MKISFEFDDDSAAFEILDAAFVGMLKRELKTTKSFIYTDLYNHPDDVKMYKKVTKALELLIRYYGGPDDSVSDA